jgi:golgi-associated PDZ and coiled-coil motif-containing protein
MSSVSVASFRWLDALEKEFDNAYVDIDLLFNELQNDSDNGDLSDELLADIVESSRDKLKIMCSAWSQLVHKSQTIFQINCKYEAQLVDLRSSLVEANGFKQASEKELEKLLIELHTAQLQTQRLKSSGSSSSIASAPLSPSTTTTSDTTTDIIQKKLDEELKRRFSSDNLDFNLALLKAELSEYKKENQSYKEQFVNMYSEINGARLAAKYLDKELAGRIQQIQLFGKNLKSDEHERLWNQLEAEIHLHRHKTVVKACLNKKVKQKTNLISSQEQESSTSFNQSNNISKDTVKKDKKLNISNEKRVVNLKRTDVKEPLGLSITGGNEHGVPIIISEIHEGGVAARNGQLFIGDAIVKVESNKKVYDLREVMHAQAVEILSSLTVNLAFFK